MARNLLRAGVAVTVWNRSDAAARRLQAEGALVAATTRAALLSAPAAILMLGDSNVVDQVLERGGRSFDDLVAGRTILCMGTVSPAYSKALGADIESAGGQYVECPVSGSRQPAETAQLVAMAAGTSVAIKTVRPLLEAMCSAIFECGAVPNALAAKLSANLFLITMVTGLAEAAHHARTHGVPLGLLQKIIDAGPMASSVSRAKLDKLVRGDLSAQAAIGDVLMNARLIIDAAQGTDKSMHLLPVCERLLVEAVARGDGDLDMIGVVR